MSILEEMFDDDRQNLNERPYSRGRSAMDSMKGAAKGLVGSGQVEQGAQEIGQEANRLWNEFKRYVGRKYGTQPKSVTFQDVANFFKGNQLDISVLGANQNRSFAPKDVGKALLQAARLAGDEFKQQEPKQDAPQAAPAGKPQEAPKPQSTPQGEQGKGAGLESRLAGLSKEDREKLIRLIS